MRRSIRLGISKEEKVAGRIIRLAGAALVTVANGTLRAETVAFVILTNSATPSSEIKSVREGFSRFLPQYWPLSHG